MAIKTELVLNQAFNGTSDFSIIPSIAPNPTQGTIIIVCTPDDFRQSMIYYTGESLSGNGWGTEDEFHISTDAGAAGGGLVFYWGSTAITGNLYDLNFINNYIPGTKYHLAVRYTNNGLVELFLNGIKVVSDTVAKLIDTSRWAQTLLGKPTENIRYYKGSIERIVIADYPMSDSEIQQDFNPCQLPIGGFSIVQMP